MRIPLLSSDLIELLDRTVQEKCPRASDGEREIWIYAGKRELVRKLKEQLALTEDAAVDDGVKPLNEGGAEQNGNTSFTDAAYRGNRLDD